VIIGMESLSIEKLLIGGVVILGVLIAQAEDFIPGLRMTNQDS